MFCPFRMGHFTYQADELDCPRVNDIGKETHKPKPEAVRERTGAKPSRSSLSGNLLPRYESTGLKEHRIVVSWLGRTGVSRFWEIKRSFSISEAKLVPNSILLKS